MMKITLRILALAIAVITSNAISAQEQPVETTRDSPRVRSFRIGGKLGFPNLVGGNLEYVTPLLNKKLSVSIDYSTLKLGRILALNEEETDDVEESETSTLTFNYMEGGLNYYFLRPGSGLYRGISYGMIKVEGMLYDTYTNDNGISGNGIVDFSHNSINVELGAKLGGLFYFRPEVGCSFSPLPGAYETEVIYEDGTWKPR